jgi:non-canonical purine NTP pyrophosphatase (RdgB/HAM1 family)
MDKILYVTTNSGKLASANMYFKDSGIEIIGKDVEIDEPEINDIDAIATLKVKTAYEKFGVPCIANDSGFYINAWPKCKNWPGAFVHRELINKVGIDNVLFEMENVDDRTCYFKQTLAYYDGKEVRLFHSISPGELQTFRDTDYKNDRRWSELWEIFIPEGYNITLSQFTNEMLEERAKKTLDCLAVFKNWLLTDK